MCEACIMSPVRATGAKWKRLDTLGKMVYMGTCCVFHADWLTFQQ